jgi:hypothetical protein
MGRSAFTGFSVAVLLWASSSLAEGSASPGAPTAPLAAVADTVLVHADSPRPVRLEMLAVDGSWRTTCTSPCDVPVPASATYRIAGDGIRDSRTFHLQPGARTTLAVDPTSSGARTGAVVLTVVGSVGLLPIAGVSALIVVGEIAGVILICPIAAAFESVQSAQGKEYGDCLGDIGTLFAPGYAQPWVWVPALAGGALLTGGIIGLASTPRTGVLQAAPAQPVAFAMPPTIDALRLPRPVVYPALVIRF